MLKFLALKNLLALLPDELWLATQLADFLTERHDEMEETGRCITSNTSNTSHNFHMFASKSTELRCQHVLPTKRRDPKSLQPILLPGPGHVSSRASTRCYLGFAMIRISDRNLAQLGRNASHHGSMWQCTLDPVKVAEHITRGASLSHPSLPAWPCRKFEVSTWSTIKTSQWQEIIPPMRNTHRKYRRFFETRNSHAMLRLQDYALNFKLDMLDRLATKRGLTLRSVVWCLSL